MPASIMSGMKSQGEALAGSSGDEHDRAGAKSAHDELAFCADVPQLHAKGDRAGQAGNRIGVALTMVSERTPMLPNEALAMWA